MSSAQIRHLEEMDNGGPLDIKVSFMCIITLTWSFLLIVTRYYPGHNLPLFPKTSVFPSHN